MVEDKTPHDDEKIPIIKEEQAKPWRPPEEEEGEQAEKDEGEGDEETDTCEVARFPKGFWPSVDYLLQHPEQILQSLKQDSDLWQLSRIFFVITIVMSASYGAVMGATNLLQGSEMAMWGKLAMIASTAVKAPVLFLLTFLIVLPPIYVSNAFMGARSAFRLIVTEMMAALAISSTVLASMASVAFFFALTSHTYDFIKLLHVLFFAYAGLTGVACLISFVKAVGAGGKRVTPGMLFFAWLVLYAFVGTQLAWVLRPFVGSPGRPYQLFRPREGNFYESVSDSLSSLLDK
jgi:hypothetical protein